MSDDMRSQKFTYETEDFKPYIRKNPHKRRNLIILSLIGAVVVLVLAIGFYKSFIYHEELSPDEAMDRTFTNLSNYFGRESYITEAVSAEDWFDLLDGGRVGIASAIKLKELGDFGLGIEELAAGANIETNAIIDTSDNTVCGDVNVGWTLFTVDLIDFYGDDETITMSSPEFFDETLLLNKSELTFFDEPISQLYEEVVTDGLSGFLSGVCQDAQDTDYGWSQIAESEYGNMSLRELMGLSKFTTTVKALDKKKTFVVNGGEEKCYGYEVKAESELLSEPIIITFYTDRLYRPVSLVAEYSFINDEGEESGINVSLLFSGSDNPADLIKGELTFYAGDDLINGSFELKTQNGDEAVGISFEGSLSVPGINLSADIDLDFDKETGSFVITSSMTDEVDVLEITSKGSLENDIDNNTLKLAFNKLKVIYSDKDIFTVNLKLELTDETDNTEGVIPPSEEDDNVVDILNMTDEDARSIYNQVLERISYYEELFRQVMSY